jgi:hypothetical protein
MIILCISTLSSLNGLNNILLITSYVMSGHAPTSNLCGICERDIATEMHFLDCTENTHSLAQLNEELWKVFNKHQLDPHLRKIVYQGFAFWIAEELTGAPQPCQLHN